MYQYDRLLYNEFWGFGQARVMNIVNSRAAAIGGPIGDPNYYAQIMLVLILWLNRLDGNSKKQPATVGWLGVVGDRPDSCVDFLGRLCCGSGDGHFTLLYRPPPRRTGCFAADGGNRDSVFLPDSYLDHANLTEHFYKPML
jgi:hypothetical protein